jgi:transposase-like protein
MEEKKAPRRIFTPEQKFEIVQDIERHASIKEGLQKYQIVDSLYWK